MIVEVGDAEFVILADKLEQFAPSISLIMSALGLAIASSCGRCGLQTNFSSIQNYPTYSVSLMDLYCRIANLVCFQSMLGDSGLNKTNAKAEECRSFVEREEWDEATNCWNQAEVLIETVN